MDGVLTIANNTATLPAVQQKDYLRAGPRSAVSSCPTACFAIIVPIAPRCAVYL
jgi:hypothetical protein